MKTLSRKFLVLLMVVATVFSLTGCTFHKEETNTVTDANGNTTTTTTVTDENGTTTTTTTTLAGEEEEEVAEPEETEEDNRIVATIVFENSCGIDFAELHFASSKGDDWGDDILGSNAPLRDGEVITYEDAFTYSTDDTSWDIMVYDEEGTSIEFKGIDMVNAADANNIKITFIAEGDGVSATIE